MMKELSPSIISSHRLVIAAVFCGSFISQAVFSASPQKIASLSLASDEILLDLLPKCGGRQRIVALSTFADDPGSSSVVEAAKTVKGRVHSEPESLFSLKPDLIVAASYNRPELIRMIKARKVPMLLLDKFSSVSDIAQHIQDIGDAVDCSKEALLLKDTFLQEVAAPISPATPTVKKLRFINYSPDMVVMGLDTLFDELVTRAGGINAAGELGLRNWPRIDMEMLLKAKPDKIIVIGVDTPKARAAIKNHPVWGRLPAVIKGDQLIFLDSNSALSTSHYFSRAIVSLKKHL
jgi:iron complex transport system substrate-binding protein